MQQLDEKEPSGILAIIATYNPDIPKLEKLLLELDHPEINTIIIDNGSKVKPVIKSNRAAIIENKNNEGLAAAQNQGVEYAKTKNFEHIIFLDQDSFLSKSSLDSLLDDLRLVSPYYKVAAIAPLYKEKQHDNRYAHHIKISKYGLLKKIKAKKASKPREVDLLISSGKIIPTKVFDTVGMMNEALFIDYIDTEWCLRAKSKGFHLFSSTRCEMTHTIGDSSDIFLGLTVPIHSPERRYYRARNSIILLGLPHVPTAIALREIAACIFHHVFFFLYKREKKKYLKFGAKGFLDGIKTLHGLKKK
ncbi:rhamnosyltransferase [Pseudomonas oryzihabitans]|uniref:rhamnosyltransferase n=1 Tax=Pseudomonas oryzihabitans TaxID=47885 RepID=UPI0011A19C5B|nr:rhamnosyltransferase [Pseudomonas psychrotolerans]